MSTNNFYFENVLNIVQLNDEDYEVNNMMIEDITINLFEELDKYKFFETMNLFNDNEFIDKGRISMNYGGKIILRLFRDNSDYNFMIDVVLYNGYYADCNIDYSITIDNFTERYKDEDIENFKVNQKMIRILEKLLNKFTVPARKVAQFSNGEAMYEKV